MTLVSSLCDLTASGIYIPNDNNRIVTLNQFLCKNTGGVKRPITDALRDYQTSLKNSSKGFILDFLHSNQLLEYLNTIQDANFVKRISADAELLFEKLLQENPDICLTYSGRIKCLIEVEKKINMLIYKTPSLVKEQLGEDAVPSIQDYINNLERFKDTMGLRFIFDGLSEEELIERISKVANLIIPFMIQLGYTPERATKPIELGNTEKQHCNLEIEEEFKPFFKDYISNPKENGYQSLHIVFRENASGRYVEIQFRTLSQHVEAEFGKAHHDIYKEKRYSHSVAACPEIAKALKRSQALDRLDYSKVCVRGFATYVAENSTTKSKKCIKKTSFKKDVDIQICDVVGIIKPRLLSPREHI